MQGSLAWVRVTTPPCGASYAGAEAAEAGQVEDVENSPNSGSHLLTGTDSDATDFYCRKEGILSLKSRIKAKDSPYFEAVLKTSRLSGTSFSAELMAVRQHR